MDFGWAAGQPTADNQPQTTNRRQPTADNQPDNQHPPGWPQVAGAARGRRSDRQPASDNQRHRTLARKPQSVCLLDGYSDILTAMSKKPKAKPAPAFDLAHAIPLVEAAALADVTDTWMRRLVEAGTVIGTRIGKHYLVDRRSAAAYTRNPNRGRPRKNP